MDKPLLSIIIPVAPNRSDRLKAILSRLTLNKRLFPDHTFEVVIVDGGATDDTKDLSENMMQYLNIKYIYVPICKFVNAGYPRNIALRVCEGEVIGMIDIDHWPSEHLVYGMLNPFVNDEDFRVVQITEDGDKEWTIKKAFKEAPGLINGQYVQGTHNVLNRGYVIDSSKSKLNIAKESIPDQLLQDEAMAFQILDVFQQTQIPFGVNNTLWTWAGQREQILALEGFDEVYCRQFAYSREDDDWRERLKAQITGIKKFAPGQGFFDGQNMNFCAIHLWHPAACRSADSNELNKVYYPKVCQPVRDIKRNQNWEWGKLLEYSFSIINGKFRDSLEHEQWIEANIKDVPNYSGDNCDILDINKYMENLEKYAQS